jgi:hypothetical protein
MKLIKLTNATKGRIGEGLILNTEAMMSFFENEHKSFCCIRHERKFLGSAGNH